MSISQFKKTKKQTQIHTKTPTKHTTPPPTTTSKKNMYQSGVLNHTDFNMKFNILQRFSWTLN